MRYRVTEKSTGRTRFLTAHELEHIGEPYRPTVSNKTIRRDKVMRLARARKLVAIGSRSFDDQHGESRLMHERPVNLVEGGIGRKEGYVNLEPWDFKTKSGAAYEHPDGTITLHVHSNLNYTLRVVRAGTYRENL